MPSCWRRWCSLATALGGMAARWQRCGRQGSLRLGRPLPTTHVQVRAGSGLSDCPAATRPHCALHDAGIHYDNWQWNYTHQHDRCIKENTTQLPAASTDEAVRSTSLHWMGPQLVKHSGCIVTEAVARASDVDEKWTNNEHHMLLSSQTMLAASGAEHSVLFDEADDVGGASTSSTHRQLNGGRYCFCQHMSQYLNNLPVLMCLACAAGYGGALTCAHCSMAVVSSCNATDNTAGAGGALAYLLSPEDKGQGSGAEELHSVTGCLVSGNLAVGADGGAAGLGNGRGGGVLLLGSSANSAADGSSSSSSAVSARLVAKDTQMWGNKASRDGGAVAVEQCSSSTCRLVLSQVSMHNNTAVQGGGGAVYATDPAAVFEEGGEPSAATDTRSIVKPLAGATSQPVSQSQRLLAAAVANNTASFAPGFAADPYQLTHTWEAATQGLTADTALSANVRPTCLHPFGGIILFMA
jgi:hypothetical protein